MKSKTIEYLLRRKSELQRAKSSLPEDVRTIFDAKLPKFMPEESFYIIRSDADSVWTKRLGKAIPDIFAKKRTKRDAKEKRGPRKTRRVKRVLRLDPKAVDLFRWGFFSATEAATQHYAGLLAESLASRHGLGEEQLAWIENEIESFVKGKLNDDVIGSWLAGAIAESHQDYLELKKLPEFGEVVSRIHNRIPEWPAPILGAMYKLRLIVAMEGSKKGYRYRPDALALKDPGTRPSYSQEEAGWLLDVSSRWIRELARENKLTLTAKRRIANDEKLQAEYKRRHHPAEQ